MRMVEIGSSADAGSSIRSTSGSTASARAMHRSCCRFVKPILDLIPERGHTQRAFHAFAQFRWLTDSAQAQADCDVVEDGHGRKGVGFLKYHTNHASDIYRIEITQVVSTKQDISLDLSVRRCFMHPV